MCVMLSFHVLLSGLGWVSRCHEVGAGGPHFPFPQRDGAGSQRIKEAFGAQQFSQGGTVSSLRPSSFFQPSWARLHGLPLYVSSPQYWCCLLYMECKISGEMGDLVRCWLGSGRTPRCTGSWHRYVVLAVARWPKERLFLQPRHLWAEGGYIHTKVRKSPSLQPLAHASIILSFTFERGLNLAMLFILERHALSTMVSWDPARQQD